MISGRRTGCVTHHSSLITRYVLRIAYCVLALATLAAQPAVAGKSHRPVIVVVANHLSLDDLVTAGPNAGHLMQHGAVALVNTGPDRKQATEARYLAMAAGFRAEPPRDDASFYQSDEVVQGRGAAEVYENRMGRSAPKGSAVCLGLPRLLRANKQPAFRAESIGLIGDAFRSALGGRTAVVGNSDTFEEQGRASALLAMDRHGVVDAGLFESRDLSASVSKLLADHSLVVVDFGDFNRLEAAREDMTDQAYGKARLRCLRDLDLLMGRLSSLRATLILCSPSRAQSKGRWSNLTPMLVFTDNARPGLLMSATTRTPGLISNIDIAPTIIRSAGLEVPDFVTGRPAESVQMDSQAVVAGLQRMERIASRNYAFQIPVLVVIGALVIVLAMLSEAAVRWNRLSGIRRMLRSALLASLALPAAFLLVDGLEGDGLLRYFATLAAGVMVVLGASYLIARILFRRPAGMPAAVMLLTSALILGDVLTGAKLLRWSIISCDPIMGLRYYGIGNEYMGGLIGCAMLAPILMFGGKPKERPSMITQAIVFVWFAFVAFVIGYPMLGANVGGVITAVAAFGAALMILAGMRIRGRHIAGLLALSCLVVAVFALVDARAVGGSHLGRAISLARMYGWDWLGYLIAGKLLMHIGILTLPQAYWPLLVGIPFLVIYGRRVKSEAESAGDNALYRIGLPATLVGAGAAFFFNDSGIVPAAFMAALLVITMMHQRLSELHNEIHGA